MVPGDDFERFEPSGARVGVVHDTDGTAVEYKLPSFDSIKTPAIKRILRHAGVPPAKILGAHTRAELLEVAEEHGITQPPDDWGYPPESQSLQSRAQSAVQKASDMSVRMMAVASDTFFSKRNTAAEPAGTKTPSPGKSAVSSAPAGPSSSAGGGYHAAAGGGGSGLGGSSSVGGDGSVAARKPAAAADMSTASRVSANRLQRAQERSERSGRAGAGLPEGGPTNGGAKGKGGGAKRKDDNAPHRTFEQLVEAGVEEAAVNIMLAKRADTEAGRAALASADPTLVTLAEMIANGVPPAQLRDLGFSWHALVGAGLSVDTLAPAVKRSDRLPELLANGFGVNHLLTAGYDLPSLKKGGVSIHAMRKAGVGFFPIRVSAGFTAADFKQAGFSPSDMVEAGFSPAQVRETGFTAKVLFKKCKWTVKQVLEAGYTTAELRVQLELTPEELRSTWGFSEAELRTAGFKPEELDPRAAVERAAATLAADSDGVEGRAAAPRAAEERAGARPAPGSVSALQVPLPQAAPAPAPAPAVDQIAAAAAALETLLVAGLAELARLPPRERGTSMLINDVGELLRESGRTEEAKTLFMEALNARRLELGDRDAMTLTSMNNLGLLLREEGRYDEARPLLEEACQARREMQGDDHPETLTSINNLGALLKAAGDLEEAEPLYLETLKARRRVLGHSHPDTLTSINNLASLFQASSRFQEAHTLLVEASREAKKVLGQDHPHTRIFRANLNALNKVLNK